MERGQRHRYEGADDEREELAAREAALGRGAFGRRQVRVAAAARSAHDLRQYVHGCHVEERAGAEEHREAGAVDVGQGFFALLAQAEERDERRHRCCHREDQEVAPYPASVDAVVQEERDQAERCWGLKTNVSFTYLQSSKLMNYLVQHDGQKDDHFCCCMGCCCRRAQSNSIHFKKELVFHYILNHG